MASFDTHCHLQDERIRSDLPSIMLRASGAGVEKFLCCGSQECDWDDVAEIAGQYPQVLPAFGLHPWYVSLRSGQWLQRLDALLHAHPESPVGEIGLDHALDERNDDEQFAAFSAQLDLAHEYRRPVSVHCRRAWGSLLTLLRKSPGYGQQMILHSYSGPPELVKELEAYGVMLSFSGAITYSRNRRAREALKMVSSDHLLLETDSPDISPVNHPGHNEPMTMVQVAEVAAQLRGVSREAIATLTAANASARLYF